jgi:hypothetical protein
MYDKILPLLGKSIDSSEIKSLFMVWNVTMPKSILCAPDYPILKDKIEKHCLRLHFGMGGNSRFLKPIPAAREGRFTAQLTTLEFTKKRTDNIPFGVKFDMTPDEVTALMGAPVVADTTTTWRKNYTPKHELVIKDAIVNGEMTRTMHLSCVYEPKLATFEDYKKKKY